MRGYREQNKIGMDCITYRMDIPLTKNKALDLEEAISINSLVVTIDLYNEFIQAYSNSPHIKVENLTTEQVLEQFTCGLRSFIGDEHVAVLSEM